MTQESGDRGQEPGEQELAQMLAALPEPTPLRPEFAAELRARMAAANKMRVPEKHKIASGCGR